MSGLPATQVYGPHLLLDCYDANPKKLNSIELVFNFLGQLPELIGMQKIGPPQLASFADPALAGITGVIMIVTSHISIHTYALKGCCWIDVFSCQSFDHTFVIEFVKKTFDAGRVDHRLIERGVHFPVCNIYSPSQESG